MLGTRIHMFSRLLACLVCLVVWLQTAESSASAEDKPPAIVVLTANQTAAQIEAAVKAASEGGAPVLIRWAEETSPPAASDSRDQSMAAMNNMWMIGDLQKALANGTEGAISGITRLPAVFQTSWQTISEEPGGTTFAAWMLLVSASLGLACAYGARVVLNHAFGRFTPKRRFTNAGLRLLLDLAAVAVFHAASHIAARQGLDAGSFGRQVNGALLSMLTGGLVYACLGRFLFHSNGASGGPLIDIARPRWHFRMLVLYGLMTAFIGNSVHLADMRMVDAAAADSWLFLTTTVLTVMKLYWFIGGRRDIASVFAGKDAGPFRRAVGSILADSYIVSAIVIWATGLLVAGSAQNLVWARAAGITQFLMIVVPVLDLAVVSLLGHMARKREAATGKGLPSVVLWSLRTPLAGAIWLIGLHMIVQLWQPLLMGASTLVTTWLMWLERLSLALIVSWSFCSFLLKYFEAIAPSATVIMPGEDDGDARKEKSRISTILPVVRNLVLGGVIAIAALVVVSAAGIDVAPLLAGFGVLGLALSFGSQTLVKDVVSGIFFLAEDAFRIGEYIDTGKLMGTVEQISLRSVRLRHHNGPIHTVPFGQITSITNYSRDWGTIKFQLRFDRDADLELIRKTAKKVGLAMLDDPEFGGDFLVPLKMQGIQDVTENSMVIRFKFTARPGNPSIIKREGMKRLLAAFKAAGLPLASNAVVVRGGSERPGDAAAASLMPLTSQAST